MHIRVLARQLLDLIVEPLLFGLGESIRILSVGIHPVDVSLRTDLIDKSSHAGSRYSTIYPSHVVGTQCNNDVIWKLIQLLGPSNLFPAPVETLPTPTPHSWSPT
jgi:hypothetical protein